MNPGQAILCKSCRHFHGWAWDQGHPNPCERVRWEDEKHVEPELSEEGRHCSDYSGPEIESSDPGLEDDISETFREAGVTDPLIGLPAADSDDPPTGVEKHAHSVVEECGMEPMQSVNE